MLNALTIDVEEWYDDNILKVSLQDKVNYKDRVVDNTLKILEILKEREVKATFFILGYIAELFPHLVRKIKSEGHEIANHGYKHDLIFKQSEEEFASDMEKSLRILENIIEEKVLGFRAPSWSLRRTDRWAFKTMIKNGLKYDSSIFPFKTFLYGDSNAPSYPYIIENCKERYLLEFPPSTIRFFKMNCPISGGFYFRILPYNIIKQGINQINKNGYPALVYLHPWEIDCEEPRPNLPLKERVIHYANRKNAAKKFRALLADFQFAPVKRVIAN